MVNLGTWRSASVTLSIKPNCVTLSLTDSEKSRVYSFDLAGRWWTGIIEGASYRRGLNGKVVAKWITPPDDHQRRWLASTEAEAIEVSIRDEFRSFVSDLVEKNLSLSPDLTGNELNLLTRISQVQFNDTRLDIQKYHQIYKPVGILPPDQYMAVVLQATEGCSFNTCTFCNFYRDRPFKIKSTADFEQHILNIKDYLGSGLSLRRTIFLGDANALVTPMPRLIPMLEVVNRHFNIDRMGGIFAFLDGFSGDKKSKQDYSRLAELGLKRIYIGMESGNPDLLKFLKKPGTPINVLEAVQAIKAGGISVGIIVLLGAGGQQFARPHVADTTRMINQMSLDLDDLVYFSELIESEGMQYTQDAFQANLQPLTSADRLAQAVEIENGLDFSDDRGFPHISRYDIREFVY